MLMLSSELSSTEALGIFRLLILTYPRYIDQPSREAVEAVIKELINREGGILEQATGWIRTEAGRICDKGSSRYVIGLTYASTRRSTYRATDLQHRPVALFF